MIKKEMTDGLSLLFLDPPPGPTDCIGASSPKEGETVRECDAENIDKPLTLRFMTSQKTTQQANQIGNVSD